MTGIRSTGFTSSAVLARYIVEGMAREQGLALLRDETAVDSRPTDRMPGWWGERSEAESGPGVSRGPQSISVSPAQEVSLSFHSPHTHSIKAD